MTKIMKLVPKEHFSSVLKIVVLKHYKLEKNYKACLQLVFLTEIKIQVVFDLRREGFKCRTQRFSVIKSMFHVCALLDDGYITDLEIQ